MQFPIPRFAKPRYAQWGRAQLYIAREIIFGFWVCFLFFFVVFFVNSLLLMAKEILAKRAALEQVLLLLLYSLPSVVAMSCPFAALVGSLMAVGRLSSDNEMLALRASGFTARRIFTPFIVIGAILSILSFTMNDVFLPLGTIEFGKVYRRLLASTPALELKPWSIRHYRDIDIITGEAIGPVLSDLVIFDRTTPGSQRVISSGRAMLAIEGSDVVLKLVKVWSQTIKYDEADRFEWSKADTMEFRISTQEESDNATIISPNEMASRDLLSQIEQKQAAIGVRNARRLIELTRARSALSDAYDQDSSNGLPWSNEGERLDALGRLISSLLTNPPEDRTLQSFRLELYKKYSIPFGALCFVFLAFPLGLGARRSGRAVGFGLGILVAVLYWAMLTGGQTISIRLGWSPFLSMWLPNFTVLALGIGLWVKRIGRG